MAEHIINKNRLTEEYKNTRRDWNGLHNQMKMNYMRMIGKQLLKESNGEYSINTDLLKEAHSNIESAKKMSPLVYASTKKE